MWFLHWRRLGHQLFLFDIRHSNRVLLLLLLFTFVLQHPHQTSHMQNPSMTHAQIMGSSTPSHSYSHIHVTEMFPIIFRLLLMRFIVFLEASCTFPVKDKQKRKREGEVQGSLSPTNSGVGADPKHLLGICKMLPLLEILVLHQPLPILFFEFQFRHPLHPIPQVAYQRHDNHSTCFSDFTLSDSQIWCGPPTSNAWTPFKDAPSGKPLG
jgi:hypothetical protein